jgi:hypothetical protein
MSVPAKIDVPPQICHSEPKAKNPLLLFAFVFVFAFAVLAVIPEGNPLLRAAPVFLFLLTI